MSFIASWDGDCAKCDDRIRAGDRVTELTSGKGYKGRRKYAHSPRCPEDIETELDEQAMLHPRCPHCGLNHAGECW
jgi:hypothetical protein